MVESNTSAGEKIEEKGDPEEKQETPLIFTSLNKVKEWREEQQSYRKMADPTIPHGEIAKGLLVQHMVKSFKYAGKAARELCNQNVIPQVDRIKEHPKAIQAVCWELLDHTINRCTGTSLAAGYCPAKFSKTQAMFKVRIRAIIETLRVNKKICKHVFDVPFDKKLVDDPWKELKKTENNQRCNDLKQGQLRAGKEILEAQDDEEAGDGAEMEDFVRREGRQRCQGECLVTRKASQDSQVLKGLVAW
jgi:hypothetical protein